MRSLLLSTALLFGLALIGIAAPARADDMPEFHLAIKNQAWEPSTIIIPADTKVKLIITNTDATAAEFESHKLNREKVVPASKEISVIVGPIGAGSYDFFNDFHHEATGTIIAKESVTK